MEAVNYSASSFDEITADGKQTKTWSRKGNDFVHKDASGAEEVRKNVEISSNSNLTYLDAQGIQTIIRGDGTPLFAKSDKYPTLPEFKFDDQGRISDVIRPELARHFNYLKDTNELSSVIVQNPVAYPGLFFTHERQENSQNWTCRARNQSGQEYLDPNGRQWWAPQGEHKLSPSGDYSIQAFIGPNQREVTRISRAYGAEEYVDPRPNIQADGSRVIRGYDAVSGNPLSVTVTNKDGTQGIHYSHHPAVPTAADVCSHRHIYLKKIHIARVSQ